MGLGVVVQGDVNMAAVKVSPSDGIMSAIPINTFSSRSAVIVIIFKSIFMNTIKWGQNGQVGPWVSWSILMLTVNKQTVTYKDGTICYTKDEKIV